MFTVGRIISYNIPLLLLRVLQQSVFTPPQQPNRGRGYCTGPNHVADADPAQADITETSTETVAAEAPVDGCATVATAATVMCSYKLDVEQIRREILSGGRGRRARSEQGPHPRDVQQQQHLWAGGGRAWTGRSPWAVKRTSAPAMTTQTSGSMRVALVLRTRRSWPVAPLKTRRLVIAVHATLSPAV
ncbi:hypothetical protein ACI65C_000017 [Semiaphis heraclei]